MKIKRIYRYMLPLAAALLSLWAVGCSDDAGLSLPDSSDPGGEIVAGGDSIRVSLTLDLSDMGEESTRGMGESVDYSNLHLYLLEFDDNGGPLRNPYTALYEAELESPQSDRVIYKVTLASTDRPKVLHLVALPKGISPDVKFGLESTVMTSLTTEGGADAYWNRLTFPKGYTEPDNSGNVMLNQHTREQLSHIPLIRNFAQIAVSSSAANFTLLGFAIVNNPDKGTMAPFDADSQTFPTFLGTDAAPLNYATVNKNYSGILPAGTSFTNMSGAATVADDLKPKYMYERPFNSIRHTYLIIKGIYAGKTYYYKLDLGKQQKDGTFTYYDILRNFRYQLNITKVESEGYASVAEAVEGVVYNNLSFDITLQKMLNISDGHEVVFVNFTTAVLTNRDGETIEFKYRYRDLDASGTKYTNDGATFIGLEPGSVIKSIDWGTGKDDKDGWRTIRLTINPATQVARLQNFTIVKPSGLGRTVYLVLHEKWELKNLKLYAGTWANWPEGVAEGIVGPDVGTDFTILFDIPDNLPEAMFPITFTIESNRQNIENNPVGTLAVTSGFSYFEPAQVRIKYIKEISWTQYNDPLKPGYTGVNGLGIPNPDGSTTRRVRCRLRTNTSLDALGVTSTQSRIVITNDDFIPAEAGMSRKK